MPITFAVADVTPGATRLPTTAPAAALAALLNASDLGLEACAPMPALAEGTWWNPLIAATHHAFAHHLPLVLAPDAVWLCIAQGFAAHVRAHAAELHARLVRHEGRLEIEIRHDGMLKGAPDNPWPEVLSQFSDALAQHLGKTRELLVADFSTTTPTTRAASEIVLMDAMSEFFTYKLTGLCGIPFIVLEGTPADWQSVRRRAHVLREYDLDWWLDALDPLLEALVHASEGPADPEFWRSFYNFDGMSGGPYMTGRINALFPYVWSSTSNAFDERNQHVGTWRSPGDEDWGEGVKQKICPMGITRVPFVWEILVPPMQYAMELLAGFFGVSQDPTTLAVRAEIGWAVAPRAV